MVMPPTFSAATPVGAVTLTRRGHSAMKARSCVLLPVPPAPVRKQFLPASAAARNRFSGVSTASAISSYPAHGLALSISSCDSERMGNLGCEFQVVAQIRFRFGAVAPPQFREGFAIAILRPNTKVFGDAIQR